MCAIRVKYRRMPVSRKGEAYPATAARSASVISVTGTSSSGRLSRFNRQFEVFSRNLAYGKPRAASPMTEARRHQHRTASRPGNNAMRADAGETQLEVD